MQLRGIIPPTVTPMRSNEEVDLPRLRELIDRLLAAGVHGIFVLGTTGEFFALDADEKRQVIATAVRHVNKRVPVFAGTGAETTREAVRITRIAEDEGADAVAVITPYFVQPSQAEMVDHFRLARLHEVRSDDRDGVGPLVFRDAGDADRLARRLRAGTCEHGHALIHVSNRGGDDLPLLVGIEGEELPGGAEHEDAVHTRGEQAVDQFPQPREI